MFDFKRFNLGEYVDSVGTQLNAPELGFSELWNGGKRTAKTGRVPYMGPQYNGGKRSANYNAFQTAMAPVPTSMESVNGGDTGGGDTGGGNIDPNTGLVINYGGATGGYDPYAVEAARIAAENARKAQLKGEGNATLDRLTQLYDEIVREIQRVGGEQTGRINKDFDGKVQEQVTDMNNGMYDVDVSAAAGNLADSSWRSFDRGKVRTAADANIKTLNSARGDSLAEVGRMVATDTAKYNADKAGIERTRGQLSASDDLEEIQTTTNTLDTTKRGVEADKAKYQTDGEFAQKARSIGQYDTSALEKTMQSVIQNASATPATKNAAINDLLDGAGIQDEAEKERLKNKYTQQI